jgi:hypothetical protein
MKTLAAAPLKTIKCLFNHQGENGARGNGRTGCDNS